MTTVLQRQLPAQHLEPRRTVVGQNVRALQGWVVLRIQTFGCEPSKYREFLVRPTVIYRSSNLDEASSSPGAEKEVRIRLLGRSYFLAEKDASPDLERTS